jgi:hypothetical protein
MTIRLGDPGWMPRAGLQREYCTNSGLASVLAPASEAANVTEISSRFLPHSGYRCHLIQKRPSSWQDLGHA